MSPADRKARRIQLRNPVSVLRQRHQFFKSRRSYDACTVRHREDT
jgi:hypothetical protein